MRTSFFAALLFATGISGANAQALIIDDDFVDAPVVSAAPVVVPGAAPIVVPGYPIVGPNFVVVHPAPVFAPAAPIVVPGPIVVAPRVCPYGYYC
jgi:hypothetical protein